MKKNVAVFLDRDGTIIEEVGYLDNLEKLQILPGAVEAIRLLNINGLKPVVITNQSGVARGYFKEEFVWEVYKEIQGILVNGGAKLEGLYFCPHHPTEGSDAYRRQCACRKPGTALLTRAAEELDIDLLTSFMIGDTPTDMETAQRVGLKGILVRTGYGKDAVIYNAEPVYIADNILDAVKWILKNREP